MLSSVCVLVADPGGDPREQRNPPFAQNVRTDFYRHLNNLCFTYNYIIRSNVNIPACSPL